MDCGLPDSCVHGVLQARTLEWVAMPSSRRSFHSMDGNCISSVSCIGRQVLYHGATWEAPQVICSALNPHHLIIPSPRHGRILSFLKTDFAVCVLPTSLRRLLGISEILYIKFQIKISPNSLCVYSIVCPSQILSYALAHGPVLYSNLSDTVPFKISIRKIF